LPHQKLFQAITNKEKLICVDFQTKEMKEAGGYMQFAAIGNWILMFLGQAWFFLIAYGQFEIFASIFIVTIIIDIYLHLCEVRAAEFMKNKGVHWRNSCSGKFSGQKKFYRVFKKYFAKTLNRILLRCRQQSRP
jgi:hypothetical protein